jgi:hypothetical protein
MQKTPELIDRWDASSYSVYNAVDKAPVVALGIQHGILTSAYGELRVSPRLSLHLGFAHSSIVSSSRPLTDRRHGSANVVVAADHLLAQRSG